jgi:hypothetical protein
MTDGQDKQANRPGEENADEQENKSLPDFDFITFVMSLHRSAACHLGQTPNPETRVCQEDLPLAQQTIDILAMLQTKTQGNLTGEEERILGELLYDLRMAYVQASSK